jgi:hypothetical protein
VIRNVALLLALALSLPAFAQSPPTATPKSSLAKPRPAKPAAKKPAPPRAAATTERGPCIGVIPHIGESFEVQLIGLFSYEDKKVPIESWQLGDLVAARVRAAVGTRFAVRQMIYPANAGEPHRSLFHSPEDDIKGVVQTVTPTGECERYVVVVRSGSQFGTTRYTEQGIGIVNGPSIVHPGGVTYLFALTSLYVVDGHTLAILKEGVGSGYGTKTIGHPLNNLMSGPIDGPSRELKDFSWPPTADAVMGLREPTRDLLAASLDTVLPKLLAQ